ncbi:hypothetical protein AB5N19_11190 [Seiridium cardinale]|uniref:Uncharacterized protein n=1 Tax=Seiridium cardinale TaxID=138064 RepID=A0ABR2XS49_9PEZI
MASARHDDDLHGRGIRAEKADNSAIDRPQAWDAFWEQENNLQTGLITKHGHVEDHIGRRESGSSGSGLLPRDELLIFAESLDRFMMDLDLEAL